MFLKKEEQNHFLGAFTKHTGQRSHGAGKLSPFLGSDSRAAISGHTAELFLAWISPSVRWAGLLCLTRSGGDEEKGRKKVR